MDALELALRCSSLLMRTMTKDKDSTLDQLPDLPSLDDTSADLSSFIARDQLNESDCERHFKGVGMSDIVCNMWCFFQAPPLSVLSYMHIPKKIISTF